jgi:GNAT superfamily N-acetyltransferase
MWKQRELMDENLVEVKGVCYAPSDDDDFSVAEDEIEIATLHGYYIKNLYDSNVIDHFDAPEQDLADFYEVLFDESDLRPEFQGFYSVFVITRLIVNKEHRGQKIGSRFISELLNVVIQDASIIILKPHPIKDSPEEKITAMKKKKLIAFYKRLGFEPVDDCMYTTIE